jgi:alcohol dehydrogenase (NADP+)
MNTVKAYAVNGPHSPLAPFALERREPGPLDVEIEILYCGICHSDLHQVRNEWKSSNYPMVPGHEIVGRVSRVGKKVKRFKAGDFAGVGCLVDSCRKCPQCRAGRQQFCEKVPSFTYNGVERDGTTRTYGGYAASVVVDEAFALKVAKGQPLERVAPLLCAGITTYSPLRRFKAGQGTQVGVMGLGGLGHMAVKLAKAMGAKVTVISRSSAKKDDARRLGASDYADVSDPETLAGLAKKFDLIIDTISADHDVDAALGWLKIGGTIVLVGAPPEPLKMGAFSIITQRSIAGSLIGGIAETQSMLDFCAKKKVWSDVEVISIRDVNAAYERLSRGDVRYRFVIDLKTL